MIKYIEQLLQGQPVEWKPLGEVAEIQKGKQLNKTELTEVGRYPAYNGGVSYSGFTDTYNYPANTIIVSQGGASAGYVNFVDTEFYANAHCYVVLPDEEVLTRRFAYHYLKMKQGELMGRQIGAGIPGLSTKVLLALLIPIPPLSVQAEIVRILDSFTSLTAELEAELEARQAQYAHYRDELLKFTNRGGGKIVYRPLGEIAAIRRGDRVTKSQLTANGAYPVVSGGTKPLGYFPQYNRRAETITIAQYGTAGYVGWQETDFWANDVCYSVFPHQELDNRFLFHFLKARQGAIYSLVTDAIPAHLPKHRIEGLPIPIPPREEQERIVRLLDEFDTLTSSLTEGLPREIELRRQQYAYYRDQLLSFDEYSTAIRTRTVGRADCK